MENATKALLIAATLLIAIIMASVAVYLYSMFSGQSEEYTQIISAVEIEKFNSKFDVYVGRDDITVQEMASIANLAKEYAYQITIYLDGNVLEFTTPEDFIKENSNVTFSCNLSSSNPTYDDNGRMTTLTFIKK